MNKSHAAGWAPDAPTPAQLKEFFAQVESGVITGVRLQRLICGEDVVGPIAKIGHSPPGKSATSTNPQWIRARAIMGKNIFGVEENIAHFGVNPTTDQLAALATVPYTEAELKECGLTHVLAAIFPLSVNDIRKKVADKRLFYPQDWYDQREFATNTGGSVCWRLIKKTKVSKSINKTWAEQQELLTQNEEVPTARELIYVIIGHRLATGERLFKDVWVRTSDIDSDGYHVYVGCFDADGLDVNDYWRDGGRYGSIGLSSAWKSACR